MSDMKLFTLFFVGFGCVALSTGCDSPGFKSKAKTPANVAKQGAGPTAQTETTGADLNGGMAPLGPQTPAVWTPSLTISDAIARACGIAPRGNGRQMQASFDFDSAALQEEDRALLAQVAKCLTDGPLRGRNVTLIGRADARGEPEYNMTLGEHRSDNVKRYLIDLGVGREKVKATSRGEMDATGKDEEGWRKDRRVDLELML
jgi:peptidoglycan-associated lipoprotein